MPDQTFGTGTGAVYLKHPAADASGGPWSDGAPLDAGTAMIVTNNLGVLHRESGQQLVSDLGPGTTVFVNGAGWSTFSDEDIPDAGVRTRQEQEIAWNREVSRRYGPFPLVVDRLMADGTVRPRKVRFTVRAFSDGTNTYSLYVAATASSAPPSDGYLDLKKATFTSASVTNYGAGTGMTGPTLDLDFSAAGLAIQDVPCGPPDDSGAGTARVALVYLWLGWKAVGTCGWHAVSAWEMAP